MDKHEALDFLERYQPLPSDAELESQMFILDQYDQVREFFLANPYPECVPLFLNSFGDGSGFGVYQLVEDVIIQFSKEDVIPCLIKALVSSHMGVRYWCSQIAGSFPDKRLIKPLRSLLMDNSNSADIKIMVVYALSRIEDEESQKILNDQLMVENTESIIRVLREVLQ